MPYTAPVMTNRFPNPGFYSGAGGTTGTGSSQSYIGNYQNLPSGISNAGGGTASAYTGEVQPNSLVSTQMNGLLATDSPYMAQARQSGMNTANSRGLLNSSIAAGNSQMSAIQAGLPIAQQDASTYGNQQLANQASLNQILQQGMQNEASEYGANSSAGASMYATDMNNQGELARQRESLAYGGEQAGLNRNFQQYMSNLGYQQDLGRSSFNLAGNMMTNNQNFRNNAGLQAMNNPFLLQDPNALGGYMDWIGGDYGGNVNNLLNYSFGMGG